MADFKDADANKNKSGLITRVFKKVVKMFISKNDIQTKIADLQNKISAATSSSAIARLSGTINALLSNKDLDPAIVTDLKNIQSLAEQKTQEIKQQEYANAQNAGNREVWKEAEKEADLPWSEQRYNRALTRVKQDISAINKICDEMTQRTDSLLKKEPIHIKDLEEELRQAEKDRKELQKYLATLQKNREEMTKHKVDLESKNRQLDNKIKATNDQQLIKQYEIQKQKCQDKINDCIQTDKQIKAEVEGIKQKFEGNNQKFEQALSDPQKCPDEQTAKRINSRLAHGQGMKADIEQHQTQFAQRETAISVSRQYQDRIEERTRIANSTNRVNAAAIDLPNKVQTQQHKRL